MTCTCTADICDEEGCAWCRRLDCELRCPADPDEPEAGTKSALLALLAAVRECDCLDPTREEANEDSAWPYCFECEERWPCSGERLRVLAGWTGRRGPDA